MSLRYALLGVLEARPMTGYELSRFFESSARWVWGAPQSQIYPLLKRLEADGRITGHDALRGERLRTIRYSITEAGIDELRAWILDAPAEQDVRDAQLLRALFVDMVDASDAIAIAERQIEALQRDAAGWEAHRLRLLAQDTPLLVERLERRDPADHARVAALKAHTFALLVRQAHVRIDWLREQIALLRGE